MRRPRNECRFCRRRRCYYRITSDDGAFDEVACDEHRRELERLADAELKGAMRLHSDGCSPKSRGRTRQESAGTVRLFRAERALKGRAA